MAEPGRHPRQKRQDDVKRHQRQQRVEPARKQVLAGPAQRPDLETGRRLGLQHFGPDILKGLVGHLTAPSA
jgi:hypothetical protein